MVLTNLTYKGGTPWAKEHDPEGNIKTIDEAITGVYPQVVGAAGSGVSAVEYGDSKTHVTVLTLKNVSFAIAAAAAEAVGSKIYTFPEGVHLHKVSYLNIALQGGGTVDTDTPEIGLGSAIATGAVNVLGGTVTFEDIIVGTAVTDCSGTAEVIGPVGATAGILTGISLNKAADTKTVHLNLADGWAGADTIVANGSVVLEWSTIA